jgi:hypothetical protein
LPILGQLLNFIPSEIFKEAVEEERADRYYKKLKTWNHFVFMFYGILTGSSSLREIITNFALFDSKLAHCGIFQIPARSTVSDANNFEYEFYLEFEQIHDKRISLRNGEQSSHS